MTARGIYQKGCPSCARQVAIDVERCQCGYSFVSENDEAELSPEEQLAQDTLFEEYVNARIGQAMITLRNMQTELQVDPKNIEKANRLMKAFADVRGLRAELDEHNARKNRNAPAPDTSMQATPAFRSAQAEKAEKVMQDAGISTKTCPKCQAVLPQPAALCFCGYGFASHDANRAATDVAGSKPKELKPSR